VYQTCVTVLERELCIEPALETQQAYERLRRTNAPAPLTATPAPMEPTPHNLPALLTSFVGRERELAEVTRLLATTRLLTITGAGGTGKTRLALHVATDRLGSYPDGICFVDLPPLSDPGLVTRAVARAAGVPAQA